ncbi:MULTISPECIES: NACHT domain-containing protein [Sphingobium]|uniref:NACHT domain-containing protein n=1 Tax=Sphingobium TaxID=165695 RepID=UPI0002E255E3|nr:MULTISPECIES: ATP-binding protein [Sphingobium]WQE08799.1 ATP-binding protein [Sphingobium yanoikuyae]
MTGSNSQEPEAAVTAVNHARGAAPASGLNFQAAVTAIAAVHLLDGSPVGWLDELAHDAPLAIWAESGGPGDDVRLELAAATVEVQAKSGLRADDKLWDALLDLARGLNARQIAFGVLAVSPDSSQTVRHKLERDLRLIGSGRTDRLFDIGHKWIAKLEAEGFDLVTISRGLRIQTVAATDGNVDAVRAAKAVLGRHCGSAAADRAWYALLEGAHTLIARKGRWDLLAVVRLLMAAGVPLAQDGSRGRAAAKLIAWVSSANQDFMVFGADRPIPLDDAWIALNTRLIDTAAMPADPAAAIARYRGLEPQGSGQERERTYDAEFVGRFRRRAVIVAGPGLGKSTLLRRQAQRYSGDGYPVLKVQLRKVAASLAAGKTFEASVVRHGLDGSGIDSGNLPDPGGDGWVLLADGLDECGSGQDDVAGGLSRFAAGHPECRIIVTTRPIGYETVALAAWPHYELTRPDSSSAAAHVGRLIEAIAPEGSPLKADGDDAAMVAFRRDGPANEIGTDPQLLGMAASLIVRGEPLGGSRTQLFQQLFSSVERSASVQATRHAVDLELAKAVLDRLGWWVTAEPLCGYDAILKHATADIAARLGTKPLAASRQVRDAMQFWERIGVIERIHHRHMPLLAFVHKSFGEYAAARHLAGMDDDARADALREVARSAEWAEVLSFAAGLGLGATVVDTLLGEGELARAVTIAADLAVDLPRDIAERLGDTAFAALEQGHRDRMKIAFALVTFAARHPEVIGPKAAERLDAADEELQQIAWACAVETGPRYHDPDRAAQHAVAMLEREGSGVRTSIMGGIRLMRSDRFDLARRMALTNLKLLATRLSKTEIEAHVGRLTADGNSATVRFLQDVTDLVEPLGIRPNWPKRRAGSLSDMMRRDSEYGQAETRAMHRLMDAIASAIGMDMQGTPAEPLDVNRHPLLQLSALIQIIGYWESDGREVWSWDKPYSREAVAEILRVVIVLSDIDCVRLAREVATIRRKLADEWRSIFFWALSDIHQVDVDDPRWERLAEASPDLALVERAVEHEAVWVMSVATEILARAGTSSEHVAKMLATKSGLALASAGYLALQLGEPAGSTLLLDRLEGPHVGGMRHLFYNLGSTATAWTERIAAVAERHILGQSEWTANAAAKFILGRAKAGAAIDPDMLWRSYRHWQTHEPRNDAGGVIPDTPRAPLFDALLVRHAVSDDQLIEAAGDYRHDVSKSAKEQLMARAAQDPAFVRRLGAGIVDGTLGPHLTRELLSASVPLDADTIETIVQRLDDPSPQWRLAASAILRADALPRARVHTLLAQLARDERAEIREAAARIEQDLST